MKNIARGLVDLVRKYMGHFHKKGQITVKTF